MNQNSQRAGSGGVVKESLKTEKSLRVGLTTDGEYLNLTVV